MSGHSKWENIKRQKNSQDRARAKVFSKLSRLITNAVKEGGSVDPEKNVQLRQAIERAKEEDMPKDNIERAIDNALKSQEASEELVLEGYGPFGLAVLMKAITDNRQRTIQEIKNIFEKHGGNLSEPGAVSYKFFRQGRVVVKKPDQESIIELIDFGVEEIEEKEDKLVLYINPEDFKKAVDQIGRNYQIISSDIELVSKESLKFSQSGKEKINQFVSLLKDHPDIEKVFTND